MAWTPMGTQKKSTPSKIEEPTSNVLNFKDTAAFLGKFVDQNQRQLMSLVERWEDEKEYEDIADYQPVIQNLADKIGSKVIQMTKKPFGFILSNPKHTTTKVVFKVTKTTIQVCYEQVTK